MHSTDSTAATEKVVVIDGTRFHLIYADLLPPLSRDEYWALKTDITLHGIRVAVNLTERADGGFNVTDGQHRLLIADELGLHLDDIPRQIDDIDLDTQETLALSLNLARRQLTIEQRRALVARMRQQGKSIRAIESILKDMLGDTAPSTTTIHNDLKIAGVQDGTPGIVTGADGKQYPAMQEKTKVALDSETIMDLFETPSARLKMDQIVKLAEMSFERTIKALNLLEGNGQICRHPGNIFALTPSITEDRLRELIFEALGYQGQSMLYIDIATYINEHHDGSDVDRPTLDGMIHALIKTKEVMHVPVNRLARGRWWFDEDEPSDQVFKDRILEVLNKRDDGTATQAFIERAVGSRPRFKQGNYPAALRSLLDEGTIERVEGDGPARIRLAGQGNSNNLDYSALITDHLREHGVQSISEIVDAVRMATGLYDHGLNVVRARDALLDEGVISKADDGRYALASHKPVVIMDGQPLSAADIPGYGTLQQNAESTDAATEPTEDHEQRAPAASKSEPDQTERSTDPVPVNVAPSVDLVREYVGEVFDTYRYRGLPPREIINRTVAKYSAYGVTTKLATAALNAMIAAGNVVEFKNAQNWTVYQFRPYAEPIIASISEASQVKASLERSLEAIRDEIDLAIDLNADWSELTDRARAELTENITGTRAALAQLLQHLDSFGFDAPSEAVTS